MYFSIFSKIKGFGVFWELLEMLLVWIYHVISKKTVLTMPTLESRELITLVVVQREHRRY
jgi:hypothetical protein